jgi:hypothetical protein
LAKTKDRNAVRVVLVGASPQIPENRFAGSFCLQSAFIVDSLT